MGTIGQGGTATLNVLVRNSSGQPIDAVNLTLEIWDPTQVVIVGPLTEPTITHPALGSYSYDWAVSPTADLGTWEAHWSGLVGGSPVETIELWEVVAPGTIIADAYSYDLGTPIGIIRLNIDDRDLSQVGASVPIPQRSAIFNDTEIAAVLAEEGNDTNQASARLLMTIANNRNLLVQSRRIGRTTVDYGNVRADLMRQAQAFLDLAERVPADGYAEMAHDQFTTRQIILNAYLRENQ